MEQAPDRKRVQEFARKLFGHYTSGMLTMMVDIGHKTGLFEAAAKGQGTSQQIAVLHCMTVSLAEGGAGLGTAWGEQTARRFLTEAGFTSVEAVDAPGPQNTIYICRTPKRRTA